MSTESIVRSEYEMFKRTSKCSINTLGQSSMLKYEYNKSDYTDDYMHNSYKIESFKSFEMAMYAIQELGKFCIVRVDDKSGRVFIVRDSYTNARTANGLNDIFTVIDRNSCVPEPGFYLSRLKRFPYDKMGNPICVIEPVCKLPSIYSIFVHLICRSRKMMHEYNNYREYVPDRILCNANIEEIFDQFLNGNYPFSEFEKLDTTLLPKEYIESKYYGYYYRFIDNFDSNGLTTHRVEIDKDPRLNFMKNWERRKGGIYSDAPFVEYLNGCIYDLLEEVNKGTIDEFDIDDGESIINALIKIENIKIEKQKESKRKKALAKKAKKQISSSSEGD